MKALSALTRCVRPRGRSAHSAGAEDARDDVERDEPLGIAALGIDREGDADAAEQQLGLAPFELDRFARRLIEPARRRAWYLRARNRMPPGLIEEPSIVGPGFRSRHLRPGGRPRAVDGILRSARPSPSLAVPTRKT